MGNPGSELGSGFRTGDSGLKRNWAWNLVPCPNNTVLVAGTSAKISSDAKAQLLLMLSYSPYAKVFVKRSVRHLCDAMLQYKFINYTTTTTRIVSKIKL